MEKQKNYTFRVTHPDFGTTKVVAVDVDSAILAAAKEWGLGRDWANIVGDCTTLRGKEWKG